MRNIPLSDKEKKKLEIVKEVRAGRLSEVEAARRLSVSDRSVRNWLTAFEESGVDGLVHGNRGVASPRRIPEKERGQIESLIRMKYADFGPVLAAETLSELHGIDRDSTTVRDIMVAAGIWVPRAKRNGAPLEVHRAWRERRARRGELIQFDGSYHLWLEDRLLGDDGLPLKLCLLAAVDDATGEILHAVFAPHEGTMPVMAFFLAYGAIHGLPQDVYLDRFSTYKMTQKVAKENPDLKTQLQRAMRTLGVGLIFALSPQAKGRVERLFKTLQDRLIKSLRIHGIRTVTQANEHLQKVFIPKYNRKYRVIPREKEDAHRPLSKKETWTLSETLCRMETRVVQNDFTVSFNAVWYQILPTRGAAIRPKDTVIIREYPHGGISFRIRGKLVEKKAIGKEKRPARTLPGPVQTLVPK